MDIQTPGGELLVVQVFPESVERQIKPDGLPVPSTANNFVPSAEVATDHARHPISMFVVQSQPAFVEMQILARKLPPPATNFVPSGETASAQVPPGALFEIQVVPKSVDRKNSPKVSSANNLAPSLDETTDLHFKDGKLVILPDAPPLVEVKIEPLVETATILLPSAEQAILDHLFDGALVSPQVAPQFVEIKIVLGGAAKASPAAATIVIPSADIATLDHPLEGALV